MRMRFREVEENPEWRLKNFIETRLQEDKKEKTVIKVVNDENGLCIVRETFSGGIPVPDYIDTFSMDEVYIIRGKLYLGYEELPDNIDDDHVNNDYEFDANALYLIQELERQGYANYVKKIIR